MSQTYVKSVDPRTYKIVVVGDGTVGKTCLLISYVTGKFPSGEYVPTVFENYAGNILCDGTDVSLTLWDTAGQEDYERLRPLSYPGTDLFLLCFSVNNVHSFENISAKWHPEVQQHCPNAPFILIGTKTDLRPHTAIHNLSVHHDTKSKEFVTKSMGKKMAQKIQAAKYIECSAKSMTNVVEVFQDSVRTLIKPPQKTSSCILL